MPAWLAFLAGFATALILQTVAWLAFLILAANTRRQARGGDVTNLVARRRP